METWDYTFKIIVIGDSAVGKSSILSRFADNVYLNSHKSTIGVDFKIRSLKIDDKMVKLQLWDTAGQDRFLSITTSYYRGAQGILLVYDVTNKSSFENVPRWMSEVEKHAKSDVNVILVGNKSDLSSKRAVRFEEAEQLAKTLGISFIETSAKDATNVEHAFRLIATQIRNQIQPKNTSIKRISKPEMLKLTVEEKKPDCAC